ncbi:hypothetical protein D3C85_1567730 [compost metagenome]
MGNKQVMHASGVGSTRQAELAPGIGTQYVGHQLAIFNERFGVGRQAVTVERSTGQRPLQVRTLVQGQPGREQALAHGAVEER